MWVVYTLICALSLATADALSKRALGGVDEQVVAWVRLSVAALPLLAMLPLVGVPEVDRTFFIAIIAAMPLEVLSFSLYIKALKVSPMSLSLPFLAFTPVFIIGVSFVILGEVPSAQGVAGIALIAAGGYVLNIDQVRYGLFGPIRAALREKGSMLMLFVSFLYSFTATLVKLGINHSAPLFFGIAYFALLPLAYLPLALPSLKRARLTRAQGATLAAAGLMMALMIATHMVAVSMTKVSYMVAVKRTSLLFSVLYGCLLFREGHLKGRATGAVFMLAGFALVVTA